MPHNRFKITSDTVIPTGKVKIEIETRYDTPERMAPATATLTVNGQKVGQGCIERTIPSIFAAPEGFDVGSPVAHDYFDRGPFRFNKKREVPFSIS